MFPFSANCAWCSSPFPENSQLESRDTEIKLSAPGVKLLFSAALHCKHGHMLLRYSLSFSIYHYDSRIFAPQTHAACLSLCFRPWIKLMLQLRDWSGVKCENARALPHHVSSPPLSHFCCCYASNPLSSRLGSSLNPCQCSSVVYASMWWTHSILHPSPDPNNQLAQLCVRLSNLGATDQRLLGRYCSKNCFEFHTFLIPSGIRNNINTTWESDNWLSVASRFLTNISRKHSDWRSSRPYLSPHPTITSFFRY